MRKAGTAALACLSLLYPIVAVAALRRLGPAFAVCVLLLLLGARLLLPGARNMPMAMTLALLPVFAGVAGVAAFDAQLSIRLYPVFMNAALLIAFATTLFAPPSMIERFARIFEPDLPAEGVRYTAAVTRVWVGFFALNGLISLWTVCQPGWTSWLVYNGCISYLAAGVLFGSEFILRQTKRRRFAQ